MTLRAALVSLFAACLLCFSARASQPEGLAGKLITNPFVTVDQGGEGGLPSVTCVGFHWSELFPSHQLDPADTVTLEMAIIPFRSGATVAALGESVRSSSFLQILFSDGLVNGLPYNRSGWNDVTVQLRPATQDYMLTVNGVRAGPFAYESYCQQQGGCFTVQGFGLSGGSFEDGAVAWIDTISLVRESAVGQELFLDETFNTCSAPHVTLGGLLISEAPQRVNPGGCGGGARVRLQQMIQEFSAYTAPGSRGSGPSATLQESLRAMVQGDRRAARELEAFIRTMRVARGQSVPEPKADALIADAEEVLAQLAGQ